LFVNNLKFVVKQAKDCFSVSESEGLSQMKRLSGSVEEGERKRSGGDKDGMKLKSEPGDQR